MYVVTPKKELLLAFLLAVYCVSSLLMTLSSAWQFTTDDAYISFIYARQLAESNSLDWHKLLPRVEGYSNFLWVVIAALILKLQWTLVLSIKWFSVISLGISLIALYRLGRLFVSPLLAMMPVFLFSHYVGVAWWAVSGMETVFFAALVLLLIWQCLLAFGYYRKAPFYATKSWIFTNLILLLLSLTRFEGIVWTIPVASFIFCSLRKKEFIHIDQGMLRDWLKISMLCFLIPYALYFGARFYYFGHFLPHSYQCKALATGQVGVVDLDYLYVAMPLIIASLPYFLNAKECRHLLLWMPSLLYLLMLWHADTTIAYCLRLFLGPFALLCLSAVLGVTQLSLYVNQSICNKKLLSSVILILLAVLFIPAGNMDSLRASASSYQNRNQNREAIAQILNERASHGAFVLLGDCGVIPFAARTDLRFVDSLCLNNPQMTQVPYRHQPELYAEYVINQLKPEWIIVHQSLIDGHRSALINILIKKQFFKKYTLEYTLSSGAVWPNSNGVKLIDYVYKVYKKKEA